MLKKIAKFFKILIPVVIVLVIILFVVAKLMEDEITDMAIQQVSETIEAPMQIDKASFTLLRKFPYASVMFEGVWLGSEQEENTADSIINVSDTLAYVQRVYVMISSKALLKKQVDIIEIEIKGVDFHYNVAPNGETNFDFLMAETPDEEEVEDSTSMEPIGVNLQQLTLKDISFYYTDSVLLVNSNVYIPKIQLQGRFDDNKIRADIIGELELSKCAFENTNLHKMEKFALLFDLRFANDTLDVNEVEIEVEDVLLTIEGQLVLGEEMLVDLIVKGEDIIIGNLLKFMPDEQIKELGIRKADGELFFDAKVKGTVSESVQPYFMVNVGMNDGRFALDDMPEIKDVSFRANASNGIKQNNQSTKVNCTRLNFKTQQGAVQMSFSARNLDQLAYTAKVRASVQLEEFGAFIPDTLLQSVDGHVVLNLETRGELPDSVDNAFIDEVMANSVVDLVLSNVNIQVDSTLRVDSLSTRMGFLPGKVYLEELSVDVPSYQLGLKNSSVNVDLTGSMSEGLGFELRNVDLYTNSSSISATASISGLDTMDYTLEASVVANLEEFAMFMPDSLINSLEGVVAFDIQSYGTVLDSLSEEQINTIAFKQSKVDLSLKNIRLDAVDTLMSIDQLQAQINYSNDTLNVSSLDLNYHGLDVNLESFSVINTYETFILNNKKKLLVQGDLNIGEIDYAFVEQFMAADSAAVDDSAEELAEEGATEATEEEMLDFLVKARFSVKGVRYNDAYISDIRGLVRLTDSLYTVDKFKFNAFEGEANSSLNYRIERDGKQVIEMKNTVAGMDLKQILIDFNNFDQKEITDENISGVFSTTVDSRFVLQADTMLWDDMRVKGELKLEQGGVYNYQPIIDMEKYLPGVKHLENLKFKTLNSNIFVFQSGVYIPSTLVVTNQFDAKFFGYKMFGDDYSYHAEVFLSDLLASKSNRQKKKQDAQGEEIKEFDRKGTKLRSYSEGGKEKNGFDDDGDRTRTQNKVRVSETLLNLKFHPKVTSYETGLEEKK